MKKFFLSTMMFASMQLFSAHEEINDMYKIIYNKDTNTKQIVYNSLSGTIYKHLNYEEINTSYYVIYDTFQLDTYLTVSTSYHPNTKILDINFDHFNSSDKAFFDFSSLITDADVNEVTDNPELIHIIDVLTKFPIKHISINFGKNPSVYLTPMYKDIVNKVFQLNNKQEAIDLAKIITNVFKSVEQSKNLHYGEEYEGTPEKHVIPFFQLEKFTDQYRISKSIVVFVSYNGMLCTDNYELSLHYFDKKKHKLIREVRFDFRDIRIVDDTELKDTDFDNSDEYETLYKDEHTLKTEAKKFLDNLRKQEKKYFEMKKEQKLLKSTQQKKHSKLTIHQDSSKYSKPMNSENSSNN